MPMEDERRQQFATELVELRHQLEEAHGQIAELETVRAELEQAWTLLEDYEARVHQLDRLAAIGQLTGGIAHDFGNFLTANIFHMELLLDDPRLPPELAPTVETILSGARRTAQLVRQILDFSRRTTLRTQPVDLVAFVDEVTTILRRTLPENIQLVVDVSPDEHVASIDPARIEQVMMNLALNARDAMPDGGELRISLSRVATHPGESPLVSDISLTVPPMETTGGSWVCLSISDTGTGMAEDVRARIFEPFFTTKGEEGTGLGLAQVYGIVRQHDGHIGVETEVGQGTTFQVYLPACDTKEESLRGVPAAPRGRGETILFAEDEKKVREAGRAILELLNYRVLTARNGREALEMYQAACAEGSTGIDLVITDLVMPEMGGEMLIQELRKLNPRVKVLVITGYSSAAGIEMSEEIKRLGTIQKPFEVVALAEAIRQALDVN
jgi:two-component system cell cycle sensor histidine kinase/response regulator CckA